MHTLRASEPLAQVVAVPAQPYARRLEAKNSFTRVGLDKRTIPRSCIAFTPQQLLDAETEFRIHLKEFRFGYTGTVVLMGDGGGAARLRRAGCHRWIVTNFEVRRSTKSLTARSTPSTVETGNSGRRARRQALAVDGGNSEAEAFCSPLQVVTVKSPPDNAIRHLLDSMPASTWRLAHVVVRYRDEVSHLQPLRGPHRLHQGRRLLAVFIPMPIRDDAHGAAGLDITRAIAALSGRVRGQFGFDISVRVGIHRGVDLDMTTSMGWARTSPPASGGAAAPGTVAVSEVIQRVVRDSFELERMLPQTVKGVDDPIVLYRRRRRRRPDDRWGAAGRPQSRARDLRRSWGRRRWRGRTTAGVAFEGEGGSRPGWPTPVSTWLSTDGAAVIGMFGSPVTSGSDPSGGVGVPAPDQARLRSG